MPVVAGVKHGIPHTRHPTASSRNNMASSTDDTPIHGHGHGADMFNADSQSTASADTSNRRADTVVTFDSVKRVEDSVKCDKVIYERKETGLTVSMCKCLDAIVCGYVGKNVVMKKIQSPNANLFAGNIATFNKAVRAVADNKQVAKSLVLSEYPGLVASPLTLFMFAKPMPLDLAKNINSLIRGPKLTARQIEFQIACIVRDMLFGMKIIHDADFVHGDIKLLNVLMSESGLYPDSGIYPAADVPHRARLIDFDDSVKLQNGRANLRVFTYGFVGKTELNRRNLNGVPVTTAHDVYSLGMTAYATYALMANSAAFRCGVTKFKIDDLVIDFYTNSSKAFRDFVEKTMALDPTARPSVENLLRDPFLALYLAIPGYSPTTIPEKYRFNYADDGNADRRIPWPIGLPSSNEKGHSSLNAVVSLVFWVIFVVCIFAAIKKYRKAEAEKAVAAPIVPLSANCQVMPTIDEKIVA